MSVCDIGSTALTTADNEALNVVSLLEKETVDFSEEKRFWSLNCRPQEYLTDEQREIKRRIYRDLLRYRNGKLGNLSVIAQRSKVSVVTIRDMINAIPTPYGIWLKVGRAIEAVERDLRKIQKGN